MAKIVKGEHRGRRGKYLVDYRDGQGRRRTPSFNTRREAENFLATIIPESRQAQASALVDPDMRVQEYAERFLRAAAPRLKPKSVENYRLCLTRHVLPTVGDRKLRHLRRDQLRALLGAKLEAGLARGTVAGIYTALRAMLTWAVDEDRVLVTNPAARLGRTLKLGTSKAGRAESIKAMARGQLAIFLEAARSHGRASVRRLHPLFLLLARAGLRVGEARGLQWQDVSVEAREFRVERAFSDDRLDTPKSGHGRTVDMSRGLTDTLRRLLHDRKTETLERGWPEMPVWVFCTPEGDSLPTKVIARAFASALKAAGLPAHFTPHCLRHTFASLLLQQGESPVYVQRQLGHASITLTVDTYGRWLPMGNKAAVDRLDEATGSKLVATAGRAERLAGQHEGEPVENMDVGNERRATRPPLIA
jgi:integrase